MDDNPALRRLKASMARMVDAQRQMEQRAGPVYDLSVSRSRVVSDAYRAAGSPPKPPGSPFQFSETGLLERGDTPEWQAWRAWLQIREQLRRELGIQRGKPRSTDEVLT
jgi:hypothetical protein